MDFSKSTLHNLDINKSSNNSCSNQINAELTEKTCYKSNLVANGDKQNAMLLKYKELDTNNMQNTDTAVQNISSLTKINKLENDDQISIEYTCADKNVRLQNTNSKFAQDNTLEVKLNEPSSISSNLLHKRRTGDQLGYNPLKSGVISINVEQIQVDMGQEEETIEKIADMIAIGSSDKIRCGNKSKKWHQIFISRNCTQPENSNIQDLQEKVNVTECNKINYLNDLTNENRKTLFDSPKINDCVKNVAATPKNKESSEDNILNKTRFEEIEDKLEEMFAGIDDEKLENMTSDDKYIGKANSLVSIDNYNVNSRNNDMNMFADDGLKHDNLTSLPTKAAKKLAVTRNDKNIELNSVFANHKDQRISNSVLYLKTIRRKHSMNKELSTYSEKANEKVNEKKDTNLEFIKGNGMTSRSLNPKNHKEIKKKTKYVPKSKIKNNRNNVEYKRDNTKVKSRNNKKKCTTVPNSKSSQQKIKHLLSSENDTEERPSQVKDIETKHRSPFILVKNNGSIAVINTVTADDSNEKFTKSKKSSNYIHERKTVKGCHSSTLSNRYDADTADSSWICVFCKIGPHKKRLGDLFGPYIISSDCDEYRCIKESTEILQNFCNRSVKYISERSLSEYSEDNTIDSHVLGMSRISDNCYEIWIHEECAIWAPNIFVVGSRLAGLEEVAWNSTRYECVYCLKRGAMLCCLQRDCKITSHVPCAREFNWLLDETRFWVYCNKHFLNKF